MRHLIFFRPNMTGRIFLFLLLFAAIPLKGTAAEGLPEINVSQLNQQFLRAPVEFLIDEKRQDFDGIDRSRFKPLTSGDVNQGISDAAFWLRVRLVNPGNSPVSWLLFHETSYIDHFVVHYRDETETDFQQKALSDRQPFDTRPVDYRRLAFHHTTAPGGYTDIYLQVYYDKADSVSLNFHLSEESIFHKTVREENLLYGGYYGILFILFLIALILSVLLRQSSTFYYSAFLLSTAFMWLLLNGFGFQYFWPNIPYLHNEGFHIIYLLFSIAGLRFSQVFLKTAKYFRRTHTLFNVLQVMAAIGILVRLLGLYVPMLYFSFLMLAILAVAIPIVSWRAWRRGLHYARWYLMAWLVYSLGLLVSLTSACTNMINWGMQSLTYLQIGSLLEAVFLTVALTERVMSLEKDRRKAIQLAHQDPLTGLGNRRLLQLQYEKFRDQFSVDGVSVFLIMMDLDHFKNINDTYGHDAGDCILKKLGEQLLAHSRRTEVCIRYGGEEFAILLHADSIDVAYQIAERIRKHFADTPTLYNGQEITHTLSIGITPVLSDEEILSVREMMARADAALYEGKAAGRNCSIIYSEN